MKKFILISIALLTYTMSYSVTIITKSNGGWFGFKTVTEDHSGPNHQLACADSGRTQCKFQGILGGVNQQGEHIDLEDYVPIENIITNYLSAANTPDFGSFYYLSDFYVKYSYQVNIDCLIIEIYTINEAQVHGFI